MLRPGTAIYLAIERSFKFKGRSRRSEFWWFNAFIILGIIALMIVESFIFPDDPNYDIFGNPTLYGFRGWLENWKYYPLSTAFEYITLPAFIAVSMRRLHDVGRRGWPVLVLTIASEILAYMSPQTSLSTTDTDKVSSLVWPLPIISLPYIFMSVIVIAFGLYLLLMTVRDGHPNDNRYGPSPKYDAGASVFD